MTEFAADELRDFIRMRDMRAAGYYESEGSVPMPEIVADGGESALRDLLRERRVPVAPDRARKHAQTNIFCTNCDRLTQHGQVATYANTGQPVFHCNICCTCHLCIERLSGSQRLYEAVNNIGDKLADWEAGSGTVPSPAFCTGCGAMLRCSVCSGAGAGGYCRGCGQKGCAIEGCDAS